MTILNISFFPVPDKDLLAYKERHSKNSRLFAACGAAHTVIHMQSTESFSGPGKSVPNTFYYKTSPLFFFLPWHMCIQAAAYRPHAIILHSFDRPVQTLLLRLLAGRKTRFLVQHHAERPMTSFLKRWIQALAYKTCHRYLFSAKELAADFVSKGIIGDSRRIRELMEISADITPVDKISAKASLGWTEQTTLLWVGRLNSNKDPLTVLRALRTINTRDHDWKLRMVFGTSELLHDVKKIMAEEGLSERVVLEGAVPHHKLGAFFSASHYFISASHYEGSGVALCEALSCGCIPIVTDIPSFRKMTRDGSCGWLFAPGDGEKLGAILRLAVHTYNEQNAKSARNIFAEELSYEAIGARLCSYVEEAVTEPAVRRT